MNLLSVVEAKRAAVDDALAASSTEHMERFSFVARAPHGSCDDARKISREAKRGTRVR